MACTPFMPFLLPPAIVYLAIARVNLRGLCARTRTFQSFELIENATSQDVADKNPRNKTVKSHMGSSEAERQSEPPATTTSALPVSINMTACSTACRPDKQAAKQDTNIKEFR
jgi:hypothetical protein